MTDQGLVPLERVERTIFMLRGRRVILDSDLAALYGVTVKRLSEQVKRNVGRFPDDFAFVLTKEESESLRSQIATLKKGRGEHKKYLSRVFTEHGSGHIASPRPANEQGRAAATSPRPAKRSSLPRKLGE